MQKKIKISLILNSIIVAFTLFATTCMIFGFRFMSGNSTVLSAENLLAFKFFTVDSNVLMGILSAVFVVYEILLLKGKVNKIPFILYIFKFVMTVGVALTFATVAFLLGFIAPGGYFSLFVDSNLFFHLLIPLLSIISFIFFEPNDLIRFKHSFLGLIPMGIYSIFYTINALAHLENGKVSYEYDWYGFAQGGVAIFPFVILGMILATYLICFLLYIGNKKLAKIGLKEE